MSDLNENANENIVNENANENIVNETNDAKWTAFLTVDSLSGVDDVCKEVNFRVDEASEYMCIDLGQNQICLYSYKDIEEINSELANHVLDLQVGQSYYDNDTQKVYISIK